MLEDLANAIQNHTALIMKSCHQYSTKENVAWKVLEECASILNINLSRDKKLILIHPEIMSKIDEKWKNLSIKHDEYNAYRIIKASDHVNVLDVLKFISILQHKVKDSFLCEILAMDGFEGTDPKNYVQNLRVGDEEDDHIRTVREIYKSNEKATVNLVHMALLTVYEKFTDKQNNMSLSEEEFNVVDEIIAFYESCNVKDLKNVAVTKMAQLMTKKQKRKTIDSEVVAKKSKL